MIARLFDSVLIGKVSREKEPFDYSDGSFLFCSGLSIIMAEFSVTSL